MILNNNVVKGGLTEKVTFKQRLQEMREQAMWISQGKTVQAEEQTSKPSGRGMPVEKWRTSQEACMARAE